MAGAILVGDSHLLFLRLLYFPNLSHFLWSLVYSQLSDVVTAVLHYSIPLRMYVRVIHHRTIGTAQSEDDGRDSPREFIL